MVLHRDAVTFHEKIAEANNIPPLRDKMRLTMTLIDQALTTRGPDSGFRLRLDQPLVLAAEDVVDHDQVALLTLLWARTLTPTSELNNDPYVSSADRFNRQFVQQVWRQDAETLPVFTDLDDVNALTHINLAYDILHGGRPDRLEVISGETPLPSALAATLTANPDLNIAVL
jgi:hypothetical protein